MDGILGEKSVFDGEEQDFKYILDSDVFHNVPITDPLGSLSSSSYYDDYDYLFDDDPMLATNSDKMAPASPHITTDHCYSMVSQPSSPLALDIKQEDDLDSDFDQDGLEDMLPVSPENEVHHLSLIGDHGNSARSNQEEATPTGFLLTLDTLGGKSLLTPTTTANNGTIVNQQGLPTATHMLQQKQEGSKIKLELVTTMLSVDNGLDSRLQLPPTPPGSTASDSDGGESPQRSLPSSPRALPAIKPASKPICHARNLTPQLFTNIQKLPQSGPLMLTEEEKRTLRQEGYPIPTKLPLTKTEEKTLKKVRRKIKNKISAQESRRKKKEYLESLEKRMDSYTSENMKLRQKVDTLETTNQSLLSQLTKLQNIVNKISKPLKANTTQTGTCLMVLVLCFAVFLGSWTPHSFLNSSTQRLPRLFSSSHSLPTSQMPNPYYNPYDDAAMDIDDDTDPIFRAYGPNLASDSSDDSDPYGTKSLRSSRTLLSYDEHDNDDLYNDLHRYHHDLDSEASLEGHMKPQIPSGFGAGAGLVAGVSDVANLESDKGLEAYMMHPDMEVKIIPTDTMALINRSSNK